ncbi:MAG: NUDIX hydrolase [Candidatus Abyssobacteria bacterium SURF_17]|uniref:GDP-mannose pyrophosphatase n=1 Tax=Candidatus Abyssobacteria bacterium SURF_17 TaxID=2093361 RepID=A0A419F8H2_9BACT|nr:MAG: NUDIX hydrolase [Candidatus Abyssubacteria bacterium SURF_17]
MKDFEVKEVKQIYSGRVVDLSVETIILPDGKEARREVVRHPGAVAIVPMASAKEVILIKQFRYCAGKTLWEIPAGTMEQGETPLACAQRELIEETGHRAGKMESLGGFYTTPGFCNEFLYLFVATELEQCESNLDRDEQIETHKMSMKEAFCKIESGEIADAKTLVGLMRVNRMTLR